MRCLVPLGLALVALPAPAAACGGFFCSSSPIDQSKEIIVYSMEDDGTLTMSVQIRYSGRDADFAWILPLPEPPDEIAVGSDALFAALDAATVPQFTYEYRTEGTCDASPACRWPYGGGCGLGCGAAAASPARGLVDAAAEGPDAGGGVTIYSQGVVGPYDTVVLGASSALEVIDWLTMHGYDIPASSEQLLDPYAAQGHVFIALRLNANAASSQLRPITLHMATDEACLPIRLTAIATTPDLPVVAIFLGDTQMRPSNYSVLDVPLTPALWQGTRWDDEVRRLAAGMGGHAFATDFGGATPPMAIATPSVLSLASLADPGQFLQELRNRNYFGSPLLLDLFERYIGAPVGQDPTGYYNCLAFGTAGSCGAPLHYDPARLAQAIEDQIVTPNMRAQHMVGSHPYTTRLSTSFRPEDMTIDPVFVPDPGLADVSQLRVATLVTECAAGYFDATAPQSIEIAGVRSPLREGTHATDEEYCSAMGAVVDRPRGCNFGLGSTPPSVSLFCAGLALLLVFRRTRAR